MVTDDIVQFCFLNATLDAVQMEESFITLSISWILFYWKHIMIFHCKQRSVDHCIFCGTCVDAQTMYDNLCRACIEVFIFQFAQFTAVNGICEICTKTFHVKIVCTAANLFVWCKSDADFAMFNRRIVDQFFCHGHDFCDTCFVICTEQSGSICYDQVLTNIFLEAWIFFLCHEDVLFLIEQNVSTLIFYNLCLDIVAGSILSGIHVCNQTDYRFVFFSWSCRNGSIYIALIIHKSIFNSQCFHLNNQSCAQNFLALGRWNCF